MSGAPHSKADQLARGPKRPARIKATREEWAVLRRAKLARCRLYSLECRGRVELHHLVPRARGGDDLAENLASLCSHHHDCITGMFGPELRRLAESLTDAEYAYCIEKLGEGALERLFGVLPA